MNSAAERGSRFRRVRVVVAAAVALAAAAGLAAYMVAPERAGGAADATTYTDRKSVV